MNNKEVTKKYKLDEEITKRQYIKPIKSKAKKVQCKNCKHLQYGYYCNKFNSVAFDYYKKKVCRKFKKK